MIFIRSAIWLELYSNQIACQGGADRRRKNAVSPRYGRTRGAETGGMIEVKLKAEQCISGNCDLTTVFGVNPVHFILSRATRILIPHSGNRQADNSSHDGFRYNFGE